MDGESDKPSAAAAETIFIAALELPPARRPAYLATACGDNQKLLQRVEALLRADEAPQSFLPEQPGPGAGVAPTAADLLAAQLAEQPGDFIGHYKLLEKLGEGGCGVVYMAQQEEPVRRKVALKVIKLGMDTRQVVGRFEAERQALALMDHSSIAKVLDAGATDTGRLFFVMELVGGIKITDYCNQNQLTTRRRLDLFIQVCLAVQHAHQKGVIHRDIKPSNVLVATQDGVPVPKVIDFGIAKATQGRLTDDTVFTAFEQFLGTPAYMSPEQAQPAGLDVDTRSDIYSLGVLLYELLTGKTPFDTKELVAAGLDEMRRTIREVEPVKPSTRLTQELVAAPRQSAADSKDEKGGALPSRRYRQIQELAHSVRGDLDWIVMKCLEKDRARRYETANGLARDLERHLNSEPVVAGPPSNLYRLQKLVQRNKVLFATAGAVSLALILGLALSTWLFFRERAGRREQARLRQQAQIEADKSQQVAKFLKDMLEGVGPSVALGRDTIMLREILDKTAERVGKELTNQPEVEIELLNTLGSVYTEFDAGKAEKLHKEALKIATSLWGNEHLMVAESLDGLASALQAMARPDRVRVPLLREALAIRQRLLGNEHADVAYSLIRLGADLAYDPDTISEGEAMIQRALHIQRKRFGETNQMVAGSLYSLANILARQDKLEEAELAFQQSLSILITIHGKTHPDVASGLDSLGGVLFRRAYEEEQQGGAAARLVEGERCLRDALSMRQQYRGVTDGWSLNGLSNLLLQLRRQGRFTEMDQLFEDALRLAAVQQKSPDNILMFRASYRIRDGRFADAAADLAKAAETSNWIDIHYQFAAALAEIGDTQAYRKHCQTMLDRWSSSANRYDLECAANACLLLPPSETQLAATLRLAEVAAKLVKQEETVDQVRFAGGLAEYRKGHFAEAARSAQSFLGEFLHPGADNQIEAWAVMAMAHKRLGRSDEARAALTKAIQMARDNLPRPSSTWFCWRLHEWLVPHILLREAREVVEGRPVSNAHEDLSGMLEALAAENARKGKLTQAEQFLRSALSLYNHAPESGNPQLADTLGCLSAVLRKQERLAEAEAVAREATETLDWYRRNTFDNCDAQGLNDLAWILATSSASELRDGPGAVALAEKAVASTDRKDAGMLDTLAAAYAEAGQYAQAVAAQNEAITLLRDDKLKKDLATRLKLYESNTPYHWP